MEKEFYKQLKSFLKELIIVFPEDDEQLQLVATSINLAIIDDDNYSIISSFYNALLPVQSKIDKRDRTFISGIQWKLDSYEYKLFCKLNDQWEHFSDNNQEVIWQYINLLFKLSSNIFR